MKKCPSCAREVQHTAVKCGFCGGRFSAGDKDKLERKKRIQRYIEKKWLKTLLISGGSFFFAFALFVVLTSDTDESLLEIIAASFLVAILAGGAITFVIHFTAEYAEDYGRKEEKKFKNKSISEHVKKAIIQLLLGGNLIYLKIGEASGGFVSGNDLEAGVQNVVNFGLWVVGTVLILAGIEVLFWWLYFAIRGLITDEDDEF